MNITLRGKKIHRFLLGLSKFSQKGQWKNSEQIGTADFAFVFFFNEQLPDLW